MRSALVLSLMSCRGREYSGLGLKIGVELLRLGVFSLAAIWVIHSDTVNRSWNDADGAHLSLLSGARDAVDFTIAT